jgi:hypothetical protein
MRNSSCQPITAGGPQLAPLAKLCEFALNYQHELPDFMAEMTVTEVRPQLTTVITAQVTFTQGRESYSAMAVNGTPIAMGSPQKTPPGSMRFTSSGEFGSCLVDLFEPGGTEFRFRKQTTIHGTPAALYDFRVPASKNTFWGVTDDSGHSVLPEFRGQLWVAVETGRVMRESMEPVHLPASFEIASLTTTIGYGLTAVGDAGIFVLPSKSESTICVRQRFSLLLECVTNGKTFQGYRKFAATTRILADLPQQ